MFARESIITIIIIDSLTDWSAATQMNESFRFAKIYSPNPNLEISDGNRSEWTEPKAKLFTIVDHRSNEHVAAIKFYQRWKRWPV